MPQADWAAIGLKRRLFGFRCGPMRAMAPEKISQHAAAFIAVAARCVNGQCEPAAACRRLWAQNRVWFALLLLRAR
jgi:hypothetical protein